MTEKRKKFIVSMRCSDCPHSLEGSQKRKCERCGELAWVSPALVKMKVDGVICNHCITGEELEKGTLVIPKKVMDEFLKWKNQGLAG